MTLPAQVRRLRPPTPVAYGLTLLVGLEVLLVFVYLEWSSAQITDPLILLYPFIWINVGLWAVLTTTPPPGSTQRRWIAGVIGVGYFLILAAVGGLVSPGHLFHGHSHGGSVRIVVTSIPPGWAPLVLYGGPVVSLSLIPFKVAGYAALAYLIYVTVIDAAGSVITGVVGLFSCVSCTWPVLGTILTGLFGGSSAVAMVASNQPYGASTVVFVSAIALLYWRPLR